MRNPETPSAPNGPSNPSDPPAPDAELSHVRADGSSHMVDVSGKEAGMREATASAVLRTRADVVARIAEGDLPKGEALSVARIAGIMAAKRTSDLIPLCHPLPLTGLEVDLEPAGETVRISARVRTRAVTGVEMEALTAASVAALTLYDMIKAVDHLAVIDAVQVDRKSGGKSGDWSRDGADGSAPAVDPQRRPARHGQQPVVQPRTGRIPIVSDPVPAGVPRTDADCLGAPQPGDPLPPLTGTARIVIASTRAADGTYEDRTGPLLHEWLGGRGLTVPAPSVVPDGPDVGREIARGLEDGADIIITSGGTGITPSDVTPEQTAPFIDRELPGILEAIRRRGIEKQPAALLTRGQAGMAGKALVVNLPGSRGGVRDGIAVLDPVLAHLLAQRRGKGH